MPSLRSPLPLPLLPPRVTATATRRSAAHDGLRQHLVAPRQRWQVITAAHAAAGGGGGSGTSSRGDGDVTDAARPAAAPAPPAPTTVTTRLRRAAQQLLGGGALAGALLAAALLSAGRASAAAPAASVPPPGGAAAALAAAPLRPRGGTPERPRPPPAPLDEALSYRLHCLFAMPAVGKVLAVVAVAAPIVLLGAAAYRRAAGGGVTMREAVVETYMVLNNCPGSSVQTERGPAADVVLHLVYIVGLLSFAIVLGVVTDDISTSVDKVRRGNHPVVERNHTVVLNWNDLAVPVLQQMAAARAESRGALFARGPVVVLADKDKEEMDEQVLEELEGSGLSVVTRSGNPARPSEQRRAAAAAADTVVVLWPADLPLPQASAQQAAVLAALHAAGGVSGQRVVVQSPGDAQGAAEFDAASTALDLVRSASRGGSVAALASSGPQRLHQIMAQAAAQPGLEDVLADLLEYEGEDAAATAGSEFYAAPCPPHLAGRAYRDVRRSYDQATLVGWFGGGGKDGSGSGSSQTVTLNPRDNAIVPAGAQLVFVASTADDGVSLPKPYEAAPPRLRGRRRAARQQPARNVVVLCFDAAAAPSVAQALCDFCGRGSRVTIVCEAPDRDAIGAVRRRGARVRVVDGNPASRRVLESRDAALRDADAAVVCGLGSGALSSSSSSPSAAAGADAQVLASVLQLQAISAAAQGSSSRRAAAPLAVVAALSSSASEDALWHAALSFHAEAKAAAAAKAEADAAAAAARRRAYRGPTPEAAAAAVRAPVTLHLLRPSELLAGMLTQAATEPQLAHVFSALFTRGGQQAGGGGHELYLRDPVRAYGLPLAAPAAARGDGDGGGDGGGGTALTWKQVQEAVRARGATALGVVVAPPPPGGAAAQLLGDAAAEVRLAPPAEARVALKRGDRLVVLAPAQR